MPHLTIKFACRLPVTVHGGLTTWTIDMGAYRKGAYLELFAACKETGAVETLLKGREAAVINTMANGITAKEGTIGYKLFTRLVKMGAAELVRSD